MNLLKTILSWLGCDNREPESQTNLGYHKSPTGVSEPVITFIKTFKENPKRFILIRDTSSLDWSWHSFTLKDKVSQEVFRGYLSYPGACANAYKCVGFPSFLTEVECIFISSNLREYYYDRNKRLQSLKEVRTQRILDKERNRLKAVYCNPH